MGLYFGGISAFSFWRGQELPRRSYAVCRPETLDMRGADYRVLPSVQGDLPVTFCGCTHVCVGVPVARTAIPGVTYSVMSPPLPAGSFVRVSSGVCVASPELCFAQMADVLMPAQHAKWGMELCSSYRIDLADGELLQPRPALTNARRLLRFLDAYSGKRGARRAKEAARWLMDGAASPRESQLALFFRIPRRSGGCGLGVPLLNHRIDVPREMQGVAGRTCYYVDLYWPRAKLAVEYDSDMFHTGPNRIARDSRRRNFLQHLGIRVVTVNAGQMNNLMELDALAEQIAAANNLRRRPVSGASQRRHVELYRDLLHVDKRFYL